MSNVYGMLVMGRAAARAGDIGEARLYLEGLLRATPTMEEKTEAWYWLAKISTNEAEKREYLENILANNLGDGRARRELAILNGELDAGEVIDPDRLQGSPKNEVKSGKAERFICPTCGGRMTYTPDGQSLICEYCESRQRLTGGAQGVESVREGNFVAALSTARGHLHPVTVHEFICQGCSASFIAQPEQLNMVCPYCASAHVICQENEREVNAPNGLIPFQINEQQAKTALLEWFEGERPRVARGQAMYLPVWTFDVSGQIRWDYKILRDKKWLPQNDMAVIDVNDILITETRRLPELLRQAIQTYDLKGIVPYDARFLANWPAETYDISLGDASLDAREIAVKKEKQKVLSLMMADIDDFHFDSSQIMVSAYRLLLLPVWLTHYMIDDRRYSILINGQTGVVVGEKHGSGLKKFLSNLLG